MNLLGSDGVVAEHVRQEDGVGPAVGDAEARAHRMGERVVDADEGVGEREPRDRRRVGHRRARLDVAAVRVGAGKRVEDQVGGLHAERVGVGRGEDRDAGLQRVGQRVDAGVGGDARRQGQRQPRVDDRHVRDERVVDQRQLASPTGDARRPARPPSRCRPSSGSATRRARWSSLGGVVGDPLAGVQEGQRQLVERRAPGARRTAASPWRRRSPIRRRRATIRSGSGTVEQVDPGSDWASSGSGWMSAEDMDGVRIEVGADLVDRAARLRCRRR